MKNHFKTAIKYIRRSPYQSIAAILIMTLTFFVVSLFAFVSIFSVKIINYFESKPQLTVFFKDGIVQDQIDSLQKQFLETNKVSSIHYVSKEDALRIYKEQNKDTPILLDLVTADILPASFEVQAKKAQDMASLVDMVKNKPFIEEVVFQKDVVDTLISWIEAFRKVGIAIIFFLSIVSIFIIMTIIGIKITIRREEIEIIKLIGATNWFIRSPFLLEGAFYGLVGAFLGFLLSFGVVIYAKPFLTGFLTGIPIFPLNYILVLYAFLIEIFSAAFLGMLASFFAVLRYL